MKFSPRLFAAALGLVSTTLLAQEVIVGASPSSRTTLDLYAEPGSASTVKLAVETLPLPVPILASASGYHKINIGGEEVWVKGVQVRVKRDSQASCAGQISQFNTTGSIAGAGQNACK
jgi:hypothetical protein